MDSRKKLTQERLKELLDYDPETGLFINKKARGNMKINTIAGHMHHTGYIMIGVDGKKYLASRLAFLWMEGYFPENQVDHRDRDRINNKWENLREATNSCNQRNCKIKATNTSGVTGVHWDNRNGKWMSHIKINNKLVHLGYHKTFAPAVRSRWEAEMKYGWPSCNTTSSAYQYLLNNHYNFK